ncbi:MAG: type VI secretion protein IcmF/TssM N-terminal domain-containing protein [Phycisphaerae bacterium]
MATMSANAVLMKFFKLPPAVRMMLALAGFGSLATILFMLLPSLRTREGRIWLLIIAGIGLVIFLVIWGIRRAFFKKKSSELSEALDSQGPTRGDIAEQEQIYREKFRAKLTDLKTNGLSVYKLPWFVLMGEPGCGKTASLIHSGLDFPLGKDEVPGFGGTRNYNWWFTNDAVILDTAGRIAFQEEGTTDKVEWGYFLKLLKDHRARCPVNGVIIALPADKLLRDNSDERAQKATILRERLRQVHQMLGVRFPTFVLVTKMDLVGGFSEFFEEIRVDLKQRNQMCGWSRSGEFQEPYDPSAFPEAFDQVYCRLRDWSMRYLQRRATEDELGLIVTFPESFRQLREPLHDYVSTIFQKSPLLEPPFFRGFYFTSAVQEGAPIFDVFSRSKAGITVAERPTKAVDSKAFFIHDLYANKVFPEHGLVFRSARHVSLNKRMRRIVWIGSAAMILLMVTIFGFGVGGVHGLIKAPREACRTASEAIAKGDAKYEELAGNLRTAKSLQSHYEAYGASWTGLYARLLFVGASIEVPRAYVGKIHARFVLDCILKPILAEVETKLADTEITTATPQQTRDRYLGALRVYTKWYGEVVGQHELTELDSQEAVLRRTEFETLLTLLDLGDADRNDAAEQFEVALGTLSADSRSFAREILDDEDTPRFDKAGATGTIIAAVNRITDSWKPLTQLSADNTNPWVRYWARFANRVGDLRGRYAELLGLADGFGGSGRYEQMVERFKKLARGAEYLGDPDITTPEPGSLHEAYYNLMTFLENAQVPETVEHRVIRLGGLLAVFQARWNQEFETLQQALQIGAPDQGRDPQAGVYRALAQGQSDLTRAFEISLRQIRSRLGLPEDVEPLTYYVNQNLIDLQEVNPPAPFEGPAKVTLARNALGLNERLRTYLVELREMVGGQEQELKDLENLQKWPSLLERLSADQPAGKRLGLWFTAVDRADSVAPADLIRQKSGLKEYPFWRPVDLFSLAKQMWKGRRANSTHLLLTRMAEKAAATVRADQMPGLARLMPGFDSDVPKKLPFDRHSFNTETPTPKQPEIKPAVEEEEDLRTRRRRRRRIEPEPEEAAPPERRDREPGMLLARYHTREFLADTLHAYWQVRQVLEDYPAAARTLEALERAATAYVDRYFTDWDALYTDYRKLLDENTLTLLARCREGAFGWAAFQQELSEQHGRELGDELASRCEALIRELVLFADVFGEQPRDDQLLDLIEDRLARLHGSGHSLPDKLEDLWRSAYRIRQGDPAQILGDRLAKVWNAYITQVDRLGPQADQTSATPDLAEMRQEFESSMTWRSMRAEDFRFIRPLLDLAQYGQTLLVYYLDSKLAEDFQPFNGRYPVMPLGRTLDSSALLTDVRDVPTIEPDQFINLLRAVARFQDRYGALYQQIKGDSPVLKTLQKCADWIKFLYAEPDALHQEDPRPLELGVVVVRDPSPDVGSAGRAYGKLTATLPILSEHNAPVPPLVWNVRAGEGIPYGTVQQAIAEFGAQYRWDLMAEAFPVTTAVVSDKHPDAAAEYPPRATGWELPGDPWSLLILMGAREDNDLDSGYWKIPVRVFAAGEQLGFLMGLRIGSRQRPFPGPIAPLGAPGALPKMERAAEYFTSPRQ